MCGAAGNYYRLLAVSKLWMLVDWGGADMIEFIEFVFLVLLGAIVGTICGLAPLPALCLSLIVYIIFKVLTS